MRLFFKAVYLHIGVVHGLSAIITHSQNCKDDDDDDDD